MRPVVLDLETYGSKTQKRFCNPLDPKHFAVLAVAEDKELYCRSGLSKAQIVNLIFDNFGEDIFLVGHNIGFDLEWIWTDPRFQKWVRAGGSIWDTCTVEYLLRGQNPGKLDLDTLSAKVGGSLKDDYVKNVFASDGTVLDIDRDRLIEYCKADVANTKLLFMSQYKEAKKIGMLPLIKVYMKHCLVLEEMQVNGLYLNIDVVEAKRLECVESIAKCSIRAYDLNKGLEGFNPASNQQVSNVLFGEIKKVDEKTLTEVLATIDHVGYPKERATKLKEFIKVILEFRGLNKILGTYLYKAKFYQRSIKSKGIVAGDIIPSKQSGFKALVNPVTKCVHTEYITCRTETGRVSSGSPNVQNIPNHLQDMFTSRFGKDGYIISVDWSQLEIVLQAYLTQSKKMIQDIASGIDFHIKRLDYACGMGYERLVELCGSDPEWKEKRKQIKGQISFKKGYGATPESVARDSGMDLEFVRDIYRKEDEEYPEISRYYTKLSEQIQKSRYVTRELQGIKDKTTGKLIYRDGEQQGYGTWTSVTGKIYTWKERAVMTKRGDIFRYFLMPEVMNYPIQGLAADFVGMMAGAIKAALDSGLEDTERGLCLMINEVHDSYLFDIHPGVKDKAVKIITDVLKNYKNIFHKSFNLDFNVPLKYEIKEGRSWL